MNAPTMGASIARLYGGAALCGFFTPVNSKKMKKQSIAARCANAKSGTITIARFNTERGAEEYVKNNSHLLTPEIVSVEIAPNDIRFHDVLFSPKFRVESYDGGFSVYASV